MDRLVKNPVEMRKKISLNVNFVILNLVRDLAKLTKTNNTLVIESLLVKGVSPLVKQFETTWTALLENTKDKEKKERLSKLLEDLKKISEKEEYLALMKG